MFCLEFEIWRRVRRERRPSGREPCGRAVRAGGWPASSRCNATREQRERGGGNDDG